jgi:adenine phosphoribosyltransferase
VQSKRGVIPIRKKGKLPHDVHRQEYGLEYGSDIIEIHKDAAKPGEKVLLVDDVLATGGTLAAAIKLIKATGAEVTSVGVLLEIAALGGREKLQHEFPGIEIHAIFIV